MFTIERLKKAVNSPHSGVSSVKQVVHLALDPIHLGNLNTGVLKSLNSHLLEFFPDLAGILMGYDGVKLKKSTGDMIADQPHVHIDIQAVFYVFRPTVGSLLRATVNKKSSGHLGCLVHDTFNASLMVPSGVTPAQVAKSQVGDQLLVEVVSVSYTGSRVVILGKVGRVEQGVEGVEQVRLVQTVSDFEESDEPDSGIENNPRKKKVKTDEPQPSTTDVTNEVLVSQDRKRKAGDEVKEDEKEKKRRRKAEKKARKEKARLEALGAEAVDSSDDFLPDRRSGHHVSFSSSATKFSESVLGVATTPKTNKSVKSVDLTTPTAKTPSTNTGSLSSKKEAFELPEGFEIKEHKTEKSKWKEYVGPDGKKYRSLADVKKFIDSTSAQSNYDAEKVDEVINYVVTEWTPDDLNRTDYANFEVVKEFPQNNTFFETAKKKTSIIKTKEKKNADDSVDETVSESSLERSLGLLGTENDSVTEDLLTPLKSDKKLKKKKKNDSVDMGKSPDKSVADSSLQKSLGHLGTKKESVAEELMTSPESDKKKKKKKKKKHESSME